MHYIALYWSVYILKSDLLEYTKEKVNLELPAPAASTQEPGDFTYWILGFDYANGCYVQVYQEEGKDQNQSPD